MLLSCESAAVPAEQIHSILMLKSTLALAHAGIPQVACHVSTDAFCTKRPVSTNDVVLQKRWARFIRGQY